MQTKVVDVPYEPHTGIKFYKEIITVVCSATFDTWQKKSGAISSVDDDYCNCGIFINFKSRTQYSLSNTWC